MLSSRPYIDILVEMLNNQFFPESRVRRKIYVTMKRRYPGLLPCFIHGIEEEMEEACKETEKGSGQGCRGRKGWGPARCYHESQMKDSISGPCQTPTNITICYVGNALNYTMIPWDLLKPIAIGKVKNTVKYTLACRFLALLVLLGFLKMFCFSSLLIGSWGDTNIMMHGPYWGSCTLMSISWLFSILWFFSILL